MLWLSLTGWQIQLTVFSNLFTKQFQAIKTFYDENGFNTKFDY